MDIQSLKENHLKKRIQVTTLDIDGYYIESCNSIITHNRQKESFFESDYILMSIKDEIIRLPENEQFVMNCVNHEIDHKTYFLDHTFYIEYTESNKYIVWIIEDLTTQYEQISLFQSERNISEQALQSEKIKSKTLIEAQKFKMQFFQNLSHEIRNPTNNILGLVDLILLEKDEDNSIEYLKSLKATTNILMAITDNLLDQSAIENNQLKITPTAVNLQSTAIEVIETFSYLEKRKQLKFDLIIDPNVPEEIISDKVRLIQILNNLVGNAVKFTQEGFVKICIDIHTHNDNMELVFTVKDSGIGISKDKISDILERFQQETSQTSELYGGLGLGLSISKQLIEKLGGELKVSSTKNVGTSFTFNLPCSQLKENESSDRKLSVPFSLSNKKILLADDDDINIMILSKVLADLKISTDAVDDGKKALDQFYENQYDAIILDYWMPELTGAQVIEKIRETDNSIPIILLSGVDSSEIVEHLQNIFTLKKPLNKGKLTSTLLHAFKD